MSFAWELSKCWHLLGAQVGFWEPCGYRPPVFVRDIEAAVTDGTKCIMAQHTGYSSLAHITVLDGRKHQRPALFHMVIQGPRVKESLPSLKCGSQNHHGHLHPSQPEGEHMEEHKWVIFMDQN